MSVIQQVSKSTSTLLKPFTRCIVCQLRRCNSMEAMQPYAPPPWANILKNIPKHKIKLGNLNTAIHDWRIKGIPSDVKLSIKRDDMTGSTLSGNKVRKLEFLMADCVSQRCTHVVTCGGIQSNHCRAVAVCARQLGLQPHLILRSGTQVVDDIGCEGNLLLDRLCASKIYLVPRQSPYLTCLKPRMDALSEHIRSTTGESCYAIPVGGSNVIGLWGYISLFAELESQGVLEDYDDIVFATGSGGTASGLAIGNYLTGSKLRIHGVSVCDDKHYFHQHCNEMIQAVGLDARSEYILDIIDGHKGQGYGLSAQEELDFILEVASSTGIMLDPVYTGKAVYGLVKELNTNPDMFKGKRILFLHTGGVFGLFDRRMDEMLKIKGANSNQIYAWTELSDFP